MDFLKTCLTTNRASRWGSRLLAVLLTVLLWGGGIQQASASHLVGADLTYTCLGNGQYEVTLTLYRDCGGISAPTNALINIASASCGITAPSVTLALDAANSGIEVSQLCPAALPLSECNGASTYPGIEVYVYTGIVTLPQGCDDWTLSYSLCCRNPDITNLVSPDVNDLYVETTINNVNGLCNNSPSFTTRPIPYICAGQLFNFNHGVVEPDGDSLIYTLVSPMTTNGVNIAHSGTFTATNPLTTTPANSFGFNTSTGQMSFTPVAGVAQTAVVTMVVFEIRNGDTIGTIMRDMQIVVLPNCTNTNVNTSAPPITIAGGSYDPVSRSFIICQGDTLLFSLTVNDPNATDTIELDNINTNLGAVFGPGNYALLPTYPNFPAYNSMELYVVVYTSTANLGVNSFSIGFTDNACPVPSTPVLGFNLIVPGVEVLASDTSICAGIAQNIQLTAQSFSSVGGAASGTYSWTQVSGPTAPLTSTTITNPIAQIPATTVPGDSVVYQVIFTTTPDPVTGTSCVTSDRVVIYMVNLPLGVVMNVPDTTLCPNNLNEILPLSTAVSGPGVNLTSGTYTWTASPASYLSGLSATNVNNPTATISGSQGDVFSYTVQYAYGVCVGSATTTFRFNQAEIFMPNDTTICAGDQAILGVNYTSLAAATSGMCGPNPTDPCNGPASQVVVGTPGGTAVFPYRGFWHDGRVQILYRASDLLASGLTAGLIREMAFNVTFKGSTIPYTGYTIKLGCTNLTQFSTGQAFVPGLTQVYTNTVTTTTGWNNYILQTPYEWDGVSNLIVEVCFDNTAWTDDDDVQSQTTPYPSTLEFETDGATGCTAASERTGTARPVIRFSNCPLAPPYTYNWTPVIGFGTPGDETLQTPSVAPPQTLTYVVEASDGTCTLTDSMRVTVLTNLPAPAITCGTSTSPATEVVFNWGAVAGATAWEYSLDSGATWVAVPLSTTSVTVSNLLNGSCVLLLVRAIGGAGPCINNASNSLECCTSPCSSTSTTMGFDDPCYGINDGVIQFQGSGGTLGAPYRFILFNSLDVAIDTLDQATAGGQVSFSNLAPGTYYGYVIDAFGCLGFTDTITLVEPAELIAAIDTTTMTLCYNTTDGTASVVAVGGTTPYSYLWDANAAGQTTSLATNLGIGFYQATVTDANGCQQVVSNIPVIAPFAQAPILQLTTTNSTACPGDGTATIIAVQNLTGNANPGQPNSINYAWDNGQTGTLTATNLGAGTHTVTLTDINGCQGIDTFTIGGATIFISGVSYQDPDCGLQNGFVTVNASGSNSYSYAWNNGQTTQTASGLGGGLYVVTVTGSNGCTTTGTFNLLSGTVSLQVVDQNEILTCFGDATGSVDIATNASGSVSYLWSNGATTQDLTGLTAGVYTVTVTSQSGAITCTATQTITIQQPAAPLAVGINVSQVPTCDFPNGAQLGIAPAGGWGGYSVQWSTGATTTDLANLPGGTYSVILTDAQGCTDTASVVIPGVTIPNATPWIQAQGQTSTIVPEGTTGIPLDAGLAAGQAGVATISWSPITNIANPQVPSTTVDGLAEGVYVYTLEARIGNCVDTGSVTLIVIPTGMKGMPSAFTPNGDGQNDVFRPVASQNVTYYTFQVFNRYGQVVYDGSTNSYAGWDGSVAGKEQARDVYVYVIEYQLAGSDERITMRGEVTLLR